MKGIRWVLLAIVAAMVVSCVANGSDDTVEWLFNGEVSITTVQDECDDEDECETEEVEEEAPKPVLVQA